MEVQRIINSGILSFQDSNPNVNTNPLPRQHGGDVNMVHGCPGEFKVCQVEHTVGPLAELHRRLSLVGLVKSHICRVCVRNPRGCSVVKKDIQRLMDEGTLEVHRPRGGNKSTQ